MNWLANPEIVDHKAIDKKRQAAIFRHKPKIDQAMIAKAKNGNVSAAEVVYKLVFGLSEKTVNENYNHDESDELRNMDEESLSIQVAKGVLSSPERIRKTLSLLSAEERESLKQAVLNDVVEIDAVAVETSAPDVAQRAIARMEEEEKMQRLGISPETGVVV
jgi:hypothetical protein